MRRLRFESLETRDLMAGNISVTRTETGELLIGGDSAANVFTVVQTSANMYQITGAMQTSINGKTAQQVANITGGISINTGAGDDQITLGSMTSTVPTRIHGDLVIKTTSGADRLQIFNVTGGTASIQMGTNAEDEIDRANIRSSAFVNLTLETGHGDDVVEVVNAKFTQVLTANTGGGDDRATFTNVNLRNLDLDFGAGNDKNLFTGKFRSTGQVNVDGGRDTDIVDARTVTSADLDILSADFLNFEARRV